MKKVFVQGAIGSAFIAESIAKHSTKTGIGAHSLFLGQIRADEKDGKKVKAIEFTAYEEMAEKEFHVIREAAFAKYSLSCMHIYHSLGVIKTGEINLFVFVSSKHRDQAIAACAEIVEEIKKNVPVFGKEIYEDETFTWKENRI